MSWRDPAKEGRPARERQRRTFERTAADYYRYRPTYPGALFTDILGYTGLAPQDRILEIGCGTGRASLSLAQTGNPLLGIEPAPAMADSVRAKLAGYPNVEIITSLFEDADIEQHVFGLVVCAQAYHWLDPATRVDRIADALRPGGSAAIFANIQVTPSDSRQFHDRVQDVYRRIAPELAHQGPVRGPDELPSHPLDGSDRFTDLEQGNYPWSWTLSATDYIGLLQTHSPHAALDRDVRARLVAGIASLINAEFGGHVTEHYVALLALARRRPG
jgi:SAM-dependent methyltransferase